MMKSTLWIKRSPSNKRSKDFVELRFRALAIRWNEKTKGLRFKRQL